MLELKRIIKAYTAQEFTFTALKGVSVKFERNEFVSILGPSGSGKTTMLNIIGGLDRYDDGDLIINNKSTELFKDKDWDAYRSHTIGFIFQSYNLIMHISVMENVELGMTICGMNPTDRRQKATELLRRVGLEQHMHKRPNQLSGGQMQRVAIARALANDPDIILADEPTGALDSKSSVQIMELIKEISKDKLVIMVTHNKELAEVYSTRIVELLDGHIVRDRKNIETEDKITRNYRETRTSMSFNQALKLSFNNLKTKKLRTLITAFAGSIGIIGVALVLALSRGLNAEIDTLETTTLSEYPIVISQIPRTININQHNPFSPEQEIDLGIERFPDATEVYAFDERAQNIDHTNVFTDSYINHVKSINPDHFHEISFVKAVAMNIIVNNVFGEYSTFNRSQARFGELLNNMEYFEATYDMLYGEIPESPYDLVLVVDEFNRLDERILTALGLDMSFDTFQFEDLIGIELKLLLNDDYYIFDDIEGVFSVADTSENLYYSEAAITLQIAGIARINPETEIGIVGSGLKHLPELTDIVLDHARTSEIAILQSQVNYNVLNRQPVTETVKMSLMRNFGAVDTPTQILIYPRDFDSKNAVKAYLDDFNRGLPREEQIIYTDLAETITDTIGGLVSTVTIVLVAFSAISLIVSSIMIGIITYISVLERTKEIGILRSLGARKKDIYRVFNAETIIVGFTAGVMGVAFAYALSFPINLLVSRIIQEVNQIARLNFITAGILVIVSITLTYISGLIPANIASRKKPVEALRSD